MVWIRTVTEMFVLYETYKAVRGNESTGFTVFMIIVTVVVLAVAVFAAISIWKGR